MATREVTTFAWTCDGCGKEVLDDELPNEWFIGEVSAFSAQIADRWVACRPACIRKAVLTALDRDE